MILLLFGILLIVCIFSFLENKGYSITLRWEYIYWAIGAILILYAGFKPLGIDNDGLGYEYMFSLCDNPSSTLAIEFTFTYISKLVHLISSDVHNLFLIYAAIGVIIKMLAFKKLFPLFFLPLSIYISHIFILHDFTQIRAAIASALLLYSIPFLYNRNKRTCLIIYSIAVCFHYSALLFFFLLFISNNISYKEKILLLSIIPIGFAFYFIKMNFLGYIPFFGEKIETYQKLTEQGIGAEINPFNMVYLVRIAIYYYCFIFYDTIKENVKYIPILLKIMGISIFSFTFFSFMPVMSFRISELFSIVDIIVFSSIYFTIKQKNIATAIVAAICFSLFFIDIFYNKYIINA